MGSNIVYPGYSQDGKHHKCQYEWYYPANRGKRERIGPICRKGKKEWGEEGREGRERGESLTRLRLQPRMSKLVKWQVLLPYQGLPCFDQYLAKSMFCPISVQFMSIFCPRPINDQVPTKFWPQFQFLATFWRLKIQFMTKLHCQDSKDRLLTNFELGNYFI